MRREGHPAQHDHRGKQHQRGGNHAEHAAGQRFRQAFAHLPTGRRTQQQRRQSVEFLRVLLEAGADPNMDPDTSAFPLTLVAYLYGDEGPAAIDLLLQHGARPAGTGALAAAASKGKEDVVLRLLEGGAHPAVEPNAMAGGNYPSPLHLAVSQDHDGVVKLLLQHGADLKDTDSDGLTAMEIAKRMQLDGKDVSKVLEVLGKQG